nr:hypothetical protein Iba_chr05bCG2530 [Ipomoea batatas]
MDIYLKAATISFASFVLQTKIFLTMSNKFQFAEVHVLQLPSITMDTYLEMQSRLSLSLPAMLSGIGSTSCRFLLDFRLVSGAIILSKGRLPLSLPAMLSRIGSAEEICVFLDSGLISGPRIPSEPWLNLLPSIITTSLSSVRAGSFGVISTPKTAFSQSSSVSLRASEDSLSVITDSVFTSETGKDLFSGTSSLESTSRSPALCLSTQAAVLQIPRQNRANPVLGFWLASTTCLEPPAPFSKSSSSTHKDLALFPNGISE